MKQRIMTLALLITIVCGCKTEPAPAPSTQSNVQVQTLMGGLGGMIVQVQDAETGIVSLYHLPPDAIDRAGSEIDADLPLLLRVDPENATETLPVRIGLLQKGFGSNALLVNPSTGHQLSEPPQEKIVEKIVEVEKIVPRVVDALAEIDASEIPNAHLLDDGKFEIGDSYIKDVQIRPSKYATGSEIDQMVADVLLENSTDAPWRPNIQLSILNKYGIKIGAASIVWTSWTIAVGERKQETADFRSITHENLFKYSKLGPTEDFDKPYCVIVENNAE